MAEGKTVYCGGFDESVQSEMLYEIFSTFGDVVDVNLPPDNTKRPQALDEEPPHKGFGFIEFARADDAYNAVDNMHQNEINGRQLKCHIARSKPGESKIGSFKPVWADEDFLKTYEQGKDKQVA